jgi:hypothetical protein
LPCTLIIAELYSPSPPPLWLKEKKTSTSEKLGGSGDFLISIL